MELIWTKDLLIDVRNDCLQKIPVSKISKKMGLTYQQVKSVIQRYGLRTNNPTLKSATQRHSQDTLNKIKECLNEYLDVRSISKRLDLTYGQVVGLIKRHNLREDIPVKKDIPKIETQSNIILLPNSPKFKREFYNKNLDIIMNLKAHLSEAHPYKIIKKTAPHQGDTLVIQFSDWHVGREIKDEEGKMLYNVETFKHRVKKLFIEMLRLLDRNIKKGTPIKDVVILSTGDILDGAGIFATQETMQEISPPFQVMEAVKVIQQFILSLLERKLAVFFYGVKGNHGELRIGGKNKDPNANWDLMLYLILDLWAKTNLKDKNLYIKYSELDYLNLVIQGWRYHIRHIAPQQAETSAGKAKFLGWARKHKCDVLCYGHYHHYAITDRSGVTVLRGGSMTGADEYAERLAEESEPIQLIWGVGQKRPVTFMYAIDLGSRSKK